MKPLSPRLIQAYNTLLAHKRIAQKTGAHHKKWLRFYLDYCHKYHKNPHNRKSFAGFHQKLRAKRQSEQMRQQAYQAVCLYYDLVEQYAATRIDSNPISKSKNEVVEAAKASPPSSDAPTPEIHGVSWVGLYDKLKTAIEVRHYSPKTLQAYRTWTRHFQAFTRSKAPEQLGMEDVKAFLSSLATEKKVAASTQNQAFNALLFLFRHVLEKEFTTTEGVVRAKRRQYIPTVLSRDEIAKIFDGLQQPYKLAAQLLYGCGLRLMECLRLRMQDLDFDTRIIIVHDGKGQKDRSLPMPERLIPSLHAQIEQVKQLHREDLDSGYDGVFLPAALDKKYRGAAREFCWQWLFPARDLTHVTNSNELLRYHLHETHLQKAIRRAVRKAQISKRATPHTFRHSFASHLLQANYDIRTIQELLGHSNLRTTMIYTHTVQSQTIKQAKSPLDL